MNWLTMYIFGSGHGMGAPFFDQKAYWLVDTKDTREHGNGQWYTWIGGAGAQLQSFEWRMPPPGTRRRLSGREFRPFNVSRGWFHVTLFGVRIDLFPLMWSVSWAVVGSPSVEAIREMEKKLCTPFVENERASA